MVPPGIRQPDGFELRCGRTDRWASKHPHTNRAR